MRSGRMAALIPVLVWLGCGTVPTRTVQDIRPVSLIAVIANPAAVPREKIATVGLLRVHWEGAELFNSKEDFDRLLLLNSVSLLLNDDLREKAAGLNGKLVWVIGRVITDIPEETGYAAILEVEDLGVQPETVQ